MFLIEKENIAKAWNIQHHDWGGIHQVAHQILAGTAMMLKL
jgi:hypothetical protein